MNDLKVRNTFACVTVRVDRGQIPADFKKGKLRKGESKFLKNDGVVVLGIGRINVIYFATSAIHGQKYCRTYQKRKW